MANKDRSARRKSEASPASKALKRLLKEQEKAKQSLTVFEQRKLTQAEKARTMEAMLDELQAAVNEASFPAYAPLETMRQEYADKRAVLLAAWGNRPTGRKHEERNAKGEITATYSHYDPAFVSHMGQWLTTVEGRFVELVEPLLDRPPETLGELLAANWTVNMEQEVLFTKERLRNAMLEVGASRGLLGLSDYKLEQLLGMLGVVARTVLGAGTGQPRRKVYAAAPLREDYPPEDSPSPAPFHWGDYCSWLDAA